jgi:hypothetical protein
MRPAPLRIRKADALHRQWFSYGRLVPKKAEASDAGLGSHRIHYKVAQTQRLLLQTLKSEAAKIAPYTVPENTGGVSCGWTDLRESMSNSWRLELRDRGKKASSSLRKCEVRSAA